MDRLIGKFFLVKDCDWGKAWFFGNNLLGFSMQDNQAERSGGYKIITHGTSTSDEVGELDYGTEGLSWHMFELGDVSGSDPRGIGIMEGSEAVVPSSSRILLDQTRHDSLFN